MTTIAQGLAARGLRCVRFEFPFMQARRTGGTKKPPDRAPLLIEAWRAVIARLGDGLVIGGKSLGGRIASVIADQAGVRGLVWYDQFDSRRFRAAVVRGTQRHRSEGQGGECQGNEEQANKSGTRHGFTF